MRGTIVDVITIVYLTMQYIGYEPSTSGIVGSCTIRTGVSKSDRFVSPLDLRRPPPTAQQGGQAYRRPCYDEELAPDKQLPGPYLKEGCPFV